MSTRDKVWVKTHVGTTSQAQRAYGVQERAYWAEPRREQVEIEKRVAATLFSCTKNRGKCESRQKSLVFMVLGLISSSP
jgi:hypothetical protein